MRWYWQDLSSSLDYCSNLPKQKLHPSLERKFEQNSLSLNQNFFDSWFKKFYSPWFEKFYNSWFKKLLQSFGTICKRLDSRQLGTLNQKLKEQVEGESWMRATRNWTRMCRDEIQVMFFQFPTQNNSCPHMQLNRTTIRWKELRKEGKKKQLTAQTFVSVWKNE